MSGSSMVKPVLQEVDNCAPIYAPLANTAHTHTAFITRCSTTASARSDTLRNVEKSSKVRICSDNRQTGTQVAYALHKRVLCMHIRTYVHTSMPHR